MAERRSSGWALRVTGIVLVLAAWQAYAMLSGNRMVPGLPSIGERLLDLARDAEFWEHLRSTLSHGLLGLLIAFVLAAVMGFGAARHWAVDAALHPLVSLCYPIPKLSLYPVVILLLGLGWESRAAQVALECFFPLFVHCHAGGRAVGKRMEWLARNVGASPWQLARDVVLPSALPFVLTGLRVALPIMLIVTTVTEFIGDSQGLGYLIARAASFFDTAAAFAVVVVLGLLGFAADRLVVWVRARLVFWEKGASF